MFKVLRPRRNIERNEVAHGFDPLQVGNVPWDGTGINCYGMGMGQINMSHGQPW